MLVSPSCRAQGISFKSPAEERNWRGTTEVQMSMPSLNQNVLSTDIYDIYVFMISFILTTCIYFIYTVHRFTEIGEGLFTVEDRNLKAHMMTHMTCIKDTPKEQTSCPLFSQGKLKNFVRFMRWGRKLEPFKSKTCELVNHRNLHQHA